MPTGTPLTSEKKALLVYHVVDLRSSPEFIMKNIFMPGEVVLDTLSRLSRRITEMSEVERITYVKEGDSSEHSKKRGRRESIPSGSAAEEFLDQLLLDHSSIRMRTLTYQFHQRFYDEYCDSLPSLSIVYRVVRRGNTRKVVSWANKQKDPEEQLQYLDDVAHVPADLLVDVDGMVQTPHDFFERYGWSPPGDECYRTQITIGTRTFAVHAAYTELGFIHFHIFEGTVTEREVGLFLNSLKEKLADDSYCLFDNAANQRTESVRSIAEDIFNGRYMFCSPYSPELKPIERGFSNVKRYIRERDESDVWQNDPVGLIEAAFKHYSVGEEGGLKAYEHFDLYRENHAAYLNMND